MESFLEKRRQLEHVFLDDIQALREDYSQQLEEIRIADAEEYNALKTRLENEIQVCAFDRAVSGRGEMEADKLFDSSFFKKKKEKGKEWCA